MGVPGVGGTRGWGYKGLGVPGVRGTRGGGGEGVPGGLGPPPRRWFRTVMPSMIGGWWGEGGGEWGEEGWRNINKKTWPP